MSEQLVNVGHGITLAYEQLGPEDGVPVVLIPGLGQQLYSWLDPFCDLLVARGYRVIRFWNNEVLDNLDGVLEMILGALSSDPPPLNLPP